MDVLGTIHLLMIEQLSRPFAVGGPETIFL